MVSSYFVMFASVHTMPLMGSGAVMRPCSFVDFGTIQIVCLFTFFLLPSLYAFFLTHLLPDLSLYSFQNRPIPFSGHRR